MSESLIIILIISTTILWCLYWKSDTKSEDHIYVSPTLARSTFSGQLSNCWLSLLNLQILNQHVALQFVSACLSDTRKEGLEASSNFHV